ncbi:autotransporter family protein [Microbulbifer hainanensis]|uniref:autotransporter family protein n=1 Tax=Microbulbifer hainanensis TaxID=2735675 RepID=UPI0018661457|nr:autotransporter outer membrane beta-barrel domain-containing protein [Microbulbifer hainanensis]
MAAISTPAWATCSPGNIGTAAADTILCDEDNDAEGADVDALGGDDVLNLNGGTIGNVDAGTGADTINILGADVENEVRAGSGNDTIILNNRDSDIGGFGSGGIDAGEGNDTIQLLDGLAFSVRGGDGNDDILLDGGFVFNFLDAGAGDDTIYWDEGLAFDVRGGDGSDTLRIDAFAYDGEAVLDGGDDLSSDDGYIDTLTFVLDHEVDGRLLRNWERIVIWGSSKMIFTNSLSVGGGVDGDGNDLGLDILFGGLVQFRPRNFVVTGNIAVAGTLDLGDGVFGSLTVAADGDGNFGDYIGKNGRLWIDTLLYDDASPSDLLRVSGDVSGQTLVRVTNRGGIGAETTGDGIQIVDIGGASPADAFVLDGDFTTRDRQPAIIGGAYAYTLHHNGVADPQDGGWYLRSTLDHPQSGIDDAIRWQPGAVLYEVYPQVLRALNQPDTLRQRVGNRFWVGSSYEDQGRCDYMTSVERSIDGGGAWIRLLGRYDEMDPTASSTSASWRQDLYRLQLGVDVPLNFTVRGTQPIASVALHYGDAEADVRSFFGNSSIDVQQYGVSTYLTWYGIDGSYFDGQLHINWFDTDLDAYDLRRLPQSRDALGYALSLEGGRSFKLRGYYSVTPQAQLIYSSENADNITDVYDVRMTDADNNAFRLRIGATFDRRVSQHKTSRHMFGEVPLERINFYITPSILYNFGEDTSVTVSGVTLRQEEDDWRGKLSFGATYDECGDQCSVYGEINASTSLENFGDSSGGGLEFGLRFKW